jgi:hypothetical protein
VSNTFRFHKFTYYRISVIVNQQLMKTAKPTTTNSGVKNHSSKNQEEIKTDFPLSEKDEVKQAEKNLKEGQKKRW